MLEARPCVMVVDDQPDSRLILEDLLESHYAVNAEEDGYHALDYLEKGGHADLILLDVMMPRMDGFETCRRIKANPKLRDIPVLFLTSLDGAADEEFGLAIGAEDFIHKPFSPSVVLARVRTHLKLAQANTLLRDRNEQLGRLVAERTGEILRQSDELVRSKLAVISAQGAIITAFCSLAEARDNETGNHIRRTQNYVRALAERLRNHPRFRDHLDDETISLLHKSAPLHDLGKVAIPDAVLLKPGKLLPEEWDVMKLHTIHGYNAIVQAEVELGGEQATFLRYAREIALSHHEKWDGSGYPQGLAGDAIPLSARLMAVADVYDALISRRVYKPPFTHDQAVGMIAEGRGSHFDPDIADAMLDIADTFRDIARRFCDDAGESAVSWHVAASAAA